MAVTIDDLPWVGAVGPGETSADALRRMYRMEPATPELSAWDDVEADRLRRRWRQE